MRVERIACGDGVAVEVEVRGEGPPVALVHGFASWDPEVRLGGVILNKVATDRHEALLREALEESGVPVLGVLRRAPSVSTPSRHLGLVPVAERHTEAVNAEGVPHKLDVSVPASRYAEAVEEAPAAVAAVDPTARTIVYGHLGDGNLHVNVLGPATDDERVDDAVLELVLALGGSVSAEHGIGRAKVAWLERDRGPEAVAAMRAIKAALDPEGLMNPGKILPPESEHA